MMRLFSEKVEPTFTSSNLNILTVEDLQEVFFDVFEFEINGKKFVAEKVSEYKESPVVDIPIVLEGKEFVSPFVLQRGKFEILFNRENTIFVKDSIEEQQETIFEYKDRSDEVDEIIFEKKEDILNEIAQARQSAVRYVEKLKQQKINEASQFFDEKQKAFDAEITESKKSLLNEFLSLVENVKGEVFEFNENEREKLSTFIESNVSRLSNQLAESLEERQDVAEKRFNDQLNELATNIISGVLLKEISSNNDKSVKDINERFEFITNNLKTLLRSERDQIDENVNSKLNKFNDAIINLEKTNIELHDTINKGDNRALSRIGNVKSQLEETILNTKSEIVESVQFFDKQIVEDVVDRINIVEANITDFCIVKIEAAEDKIKTFYNDKITLIEEKVEDLSVENKQYFIDLVSESKQSLLNEIANIKVDVPNIVIEKSNGKQEVDLKGIKNELEKIIGTRFSNELQSLKRLIEMSSGGGSVAKQFAAGGTMDGTLNVTGQYLSGGVDLLSIFGSGSSADRLVNGSYQVLLSSNGDLALPGAIVTSSNSKLDLVNFGPNTAYLTTTPDDSTALFMGANVAELRTNTYASITTNTGDTPRLWEFGVDGSLKFPDNTSQTTAFTGNPDSSNWDNAYSTGTIYQTNSASYATIDFTNSKFFPLTGGAISGATIINNNLTVFGNLTATGTTTFANTVFSTTSSLSVVHVGAGPAVWVGNNGTGDIASFYDIDQNIEVLHIGGSNGTFPNVGVRTSSPNKTFTVVGEISSTSDITTSGKIYIQNDGNSDQWNAAYTNVQSNSGSYIIDGGNTVSTSLSIGTTTAQKLIFETNNTTRLSISSGGDIVCGGRLTANNQAALSLTSLSSLSTTDVVTRNILNFNRLVGPHITYQEFGFNNWSTSTGTGGGANNRPGMIELATTSTLGSFINAGIANLMIVPLNRSGVTGYSTIDWTRTVVFDLLVHPAFSIGSSPFNNWANQKMTFILGQAGTPGLHGMISTGGVGVTFTMQTGILSSTTYDVRLIAKSVGGNITNLTNTTPITANLSQSIGSLIQRGMFLEVRSATGNTAANGIWTVGSTTTTSIELLGTSGNGTYVSGAQWHRVSDILLSDTVNKLIRLNIVSSNGTATLFYNDNNVGSLGTAPTQSALFGGAVDITLGNTGGTGAGALWIRRTAVGSF